MKGRKPALPNVVPMRDDGQADRRHAARAVEIAAEMRPAWLSIEAGVWWDRLAPLVADPRVGRLTPLNVQAFAMLCETLHEHAAYVDAIAHGNETYTTQTRNGTQIKNRPEVGQRNEAWRRALTLLREFGMTPAANRAVERGPQGDLFEDDDFD